MSNTMEGRTLMTLIAEALAPAFLTATPVFPAEKLRIASTGSSPPFTYVDNTGRIAAFALIAGFLPLPPPLTEFDRKRPRSSG